MSLSNKLRLGVVGLGRMGARHAKNAAFRTPRAELVAASDKISDNVTRARGELPPSTELFKSTGEMYSKAKLDAVIVSSDTASHVALATEALEAGLHVLMEKPISVDHKTAQAFVELTKQFPKQKVVVGFSRRFDESYRAAKDYIHKGLLGNAYMVKSTTQDLYDPSGFFVAYSKFSGGIWMDCGIHDIDMARWLLDIKPENRVKRVMASGTNVRHPELVNDGDADNAMAFIEYDDGKSITFHVGRTAMHGHEVSCEVYGTEGKLVVNQVPRANRLDVVDVGGYRTISHPTYYERFREAFVTEVNDFTAACLDDLASPVPIADALEAGNIAQALTHSFRTGRVVEFDAAGNPIM